MQSSRRRFLQALSSVPLLQRDADSAEPKLTFPEKPIDRLAVASYPFRAFIDSPSNRDRDKSKPGFDLLGFAQSVQTELHVRNIEPLSAHFASTGSDYVASLGDSLKRAGVGVVNIPVDLPGSLYDPDDKARLQAVEARRHWIDVAAAVGSPSIRVNNPPARNSRPDVALAAKSLGALAETAEKRGIIVNVENDNLQSEDAFYLAKVLDKLNSPWIRALPDFCNSMLSGSESFEYEALAAMFKRAANICHVKEYEIGDGGRVFRIDVGRAFDILKRSGFRGYCSMEWEGRGDPYAGTRELVEKSLKYLS